MESAMNSLSELRLADLSKGTSMAENSRTGVVYDYKMSDYKCIWDDNYAEKPERFLKSIEKCQEYRLLERCKKVPSRRANEEELLLQHSPEHIALLTCIDQITDQEKLEELSSRFDSVRFGENLLEAALLCVGSLIDLIEEILCDNLKNGMAIIRPPGHHALRGEFNGFCYFNNVAIAAKYLMNKGLKRILIVDWDIHHGNGIQQMFYDDPRVLYISVHKYIHGEFWPNLRESDTDYVGVGNGEGFNVNIPLNQVGLGDADYLSIFHHVILPMAHEFKPEFVLVSCGFDAAIGDLKGGMCLTPAFYTHMLSSLMGLANNKICLALEGGYFIPSLAECVALSLRTLLGDPCPSIGSLGEPSQSVMETIYDVINHHKKYWRCFTSVLFQTQNANAVPSQRLFKGKLSRDMRFSTRDEEEVDYDKAKSAQLLFANTKLTFPPIKTCLISDMRMANHVNHVDKRHPEKPDRIRRIYAQHKEMGLLKRCQLLDSRFATDSELGLVHSDKHIKFMKKLIDTKPRDIHQLSLDYNSVYLCQNSDSASRLAAGCLLQVVDNVLSNKSRNGVAIIRPPGHHAEVDHPMGFCLYNNVAIAAKYAMKNYNLSRVLILDWDIHHGNGIQHMFESDPRILYISLHRHDNGFFFPLSPDGDYNFVGTGSGEGYNVNIPWNKSGLGDSEYLTAFFHIVLPIVYQFDPELVLVSAGFDAALGDPLGGFKVTPNGYAQMTHLLSSFAEGKMILALEGGYSLSAISNSMSSCTQVLLGNNFDSVTDNVIPCSSAIKSINDVIETQSKYWTRLKPLSLNSEIVYNISSSSGLSHSSNSSRASESSSTTGESSNDFECSGGAVANVSENNVGAEKMFVIGTEESMMDDSPYCVVPLEWCPHLSTNVKSMPENKFDLTTPCIECNSCAENWICLHCYEVHCGRYVNQHMLHHFLKNEHHLTLSFSDLSVWCYGCESYVHNEILIPAKNVAHEKKFGVSIP